MDNKFPANRLSRLPEGSPLDYEPDNEQAVVYLFSHFARRRFGLHVERVQAGFPDCLAYRHGKLVRIEFEHRSKNFALHGHDPAACDWIVCWIHDWPAIPSKLRVIELRREFGLGFNVWFQPVSGEYRDMLAELNHDDRWSVPSLAIQGDLILFYRTSPDQYFRDVFRVDGNVSHCTAGWKPGKDWMAPIKRVCTLRSPIHLADLRQHKVIKDAGFVRGQMRGRYKASEYWPELYGLILARNRSLASALKKYGPERLT